MNSKNITINKSKKPPINQNLDIYITEYSLLFKKQTNKYYLCPFCQKKIPLIFPFIESFSFNLLLFLVCDCGEKRIISLKELFLVNVRDVKDICDNIEHCDICLSTDNIENILFCLNCGIWMCQPCREISFKSDESTHTLLNIKLYFKILCPIHEIYYNLYYCLTCRKGICEKCIKKQHKFHEYLSIDNYFLKVDYSFKDIYLNNQKDINNMDKQSFDKSKSIDIINDNNSKDINSLNMDINSDLNKNIIIENKIDLEKRCNINIENIYNLIRSKIELNIKKINHYYMKYFKKDLSIKNNINEINKYFINYYRLNMQLLFLIKFTYEKFLYLKQFKNINIINNMNLLTNFNKNVFKFTNFSQNFDDNNFFKSKQHQNSIHFIQKLKNFIYDNTIMNLDEGIINFKLYNIFPISKDEKIKTILLINDYDYLILTDINLLYFNTSENTMYKIVPKYIHQRVNFDFDKKYEIKKDYSFEFTSNNNNNIDNLNIIFNNFKINEIKYVNTMKENKNNKLSNDIENEINIDKINITSFEQNFHNKEIDDESISAICKLSQNLILICYKTNIIKCTFSKINNELLSINIFQIIPAHKKPIYLIGLLKNGNVITASEDKTCKIWDIPTSSIYTGKNKPLYSIDKKIFSFYEKENNKEKNIINSNIENNEKESFLFLGNNNGFSFCYNYKFNSLKNINNHEDIVTSILINNENEIITGSFDMYIKKMNMKNYKVEKSILMENRIISFTIINEYIFGTVIDEYGLYLINNFSLDKLSYFNYWKNTINDFGNINNEFFYCIVEKNSSKNDNKNNNNIIILKCNKGKYLDFIVFS